MTTTKEDNRLSWTQAEELALCKAWINKSKKSIKENAQKSHGFWTEVLAYFEMGMGELGKGYDALICK